ncbi:MAG TPA: hypothetical protein VLE43_03840 [Candidatus Saccharimonadia bacterium]|nr:hypothetical protein [Candidatus Saccharimonadia bacterium]
MKTFLFILGMLGLCGLTSLSAESRTFIDQNGRSLEGELVSASGDMVTIKRGSDGLVFTVKAANFSKADQDYFVSKGGSAPAPATASSAGTTKPVAASAAGGPPMRIEAKVYPNKSDRPTNYYFDERTARVGFKVDIKNGEQQRTVNGKATMMAFAKNLEDSQQFKVISREEFDVTLEPLKTMSHETKEVKLTYDNIAYKYGFKYSGYLLVVKDQTGKVISAVGSSATIEKAADALLKLVADDLFDKNNEKTNNRS